MFHNAFNLVAYRSAFFSSPSTTSIPGTVDASFLASSLGFGHFHHQQGQIV